MLASICTFVISSFQEFSAIFDATPSHLPSRQGAREASPAAVGCGFAFDNLRHDVALSPRFVDAARAQIMRLIVRHGELEGLLAAEAPQRTQGPSWLRQAAPGPNRSPAEKSDWKPLLAELHLAALNRAKREESIYVDL